MSYESRLVTLDRPFVVALFRHEVPTHPMPGLTSPGFEVVGGFSPEGGDTSMVCVDPSGLKPGNSHVPLPSTPAKDVPGLRP